MSEAVMDVDLRCYRPACCRKDVPTSRPILGETFFFFRCFCVEDGKLCEDFKLGIIIFYNHIIRNLF